MRKVAHDKFVNPFTVIFSSRALRTAKAIIAFAVSHREVRVRWPAHVVSVAVSGSKVSRFWIQGHHAQLLLIHSKDAPFEPGK